MRKTLIDSFTDNRIYRLNSLKIKITENCNLRCRMCNYWHNEYKHNELTTDKVFQIIEDASKLGCKIITFSGGEATLRKDLEKIINYVKSNKMSASLFTNGVAVSESRLRSLVESGVDRISVSIDSPDPLIHDDIRGMPGAFQKSIAFLENCIKVRRENDKWLKVTIASCLSKNNLNNLKEIADIACKLGVDLFTIIKTEIRIEEGKKLVLSEDDERLYQLQILPELNKICKSNNIQFSSSGITEQFGLNPEIELHDLPCYYVWENATITSNGDLYPCCDLLQNEETCMGNVNENRLADVLNSEKAADIRLHIKDRAFEKCRTCYTKDDYNRRMHRLFSKYKGVSLVNTL